MNIIEVAHKFQAGTPYPHIVPMPAYNLPGWAGFKLYGPSLPHLIVQFNLSLLDFEEGAEPWVRLNEEEWPWNEARSLVMTAPDASPSNGDYPEMKELV